MNHVLSALLFCFITSLAVGICSSSSAARVVALPARANWLATDAARVFALLETGDLVSVSASSVTPISSGWAADAPIAFAYGRLHGIAATGELRVLEAGKTSSSFGAKLSKIAGVLPLPAGVIAVTQAGDLVRFEARRNAWEITARAKADAVRDARISLADLEGDGDAEVVALVKPSSERYQHGVLGDALEPTAVVAFERHSLQPLWRLDLPAPFVFEDITARPVNIAGKDKLAIVRSGPNGGAALALVRLAAGKLELVNGPDFGQPNRWLNPLVGLGELYAVLTPHIGGVLARFELRGDKLVPSNIYSGLSSHSIGSRNLETGLVVRAGLVALPAQDHRAISQLDCAPVCKLRSSTNLAEIYSSNLIRAGDALVIGDDAKHLNFIPLER